MLVCASAWHHKSLAYLPLCCADIFSDVLMMNTSSIYIHNLVPPAFSSVDLGVAWGTMVFGIIVKWAVKCFEQVLHIFLQLWL